MHVSEGVLHAFGTLKFWRQQCVFRSLPAVSLCLHPGVRINSSCTVLYQTIVLYCAVLGYAVMHFHCSVHQSGFQPAAHPLGGRHTRQQQQQQLIRCHHQQQQCCFAAQQHHGSCCCCRPCCGASCGSSTTPTTSSRGRQLGESSSSSSSSSRGRGHWSWCWFPQLPWSVGGQQVGCARPGRGARGFGRGWGIIYA